jgi:hypothetical protein
MSIVLQSTGGGSITINEPTTASNFTQTLPASTGTVITTGSPQVGSVLQVVSANYATQTGPITTTYTDTGLSASITPKFSTSKILVMFSQSTYIAGGGTDSGGQLRILRGATAIYEMASTSIYIYNPTSGTELALFQSVNYLDSPATTSSTTYKTQGLGGNGGNFYLQLNNSPSTITLMEIAA